MDTITLHQDIRVFYVTADSFPAGIMAAHEKLHAFVPGKAGRRFFGISRPENGSIVYRAAAEELEPGEGKALNCDTLVLKKGAYICLTIHDYQKDVSAIDHAFKKLLAHPGIDPEGYCVEWYTDEKDVKCMVRLAG